MPQQILILDFGSQYTQLIARRVRELNVYCEIHPFNKIPALNEDIKGVILSGSPCSVRDSGSPDVDFSLFDKVPLLGVCYGAQLMAHKMGGEVLPSHIREYGRARLSTVHHDNSLLKEISLDTQVWMSHADTIASVPPSFEVIASTSTVPVAAFRLKGQNKYGIQFHPEVTHTTEGKNLLRNFVVHICGCAQDWTPDQFVESTIADLKTRLGNDKVVMALSGGVDSTVAATLIHRAIGPNLHCIFVDNGLLRKNEFRQVLDSYKHMGLNIKGVDARDQFYAALSGLSEPEA
ncbi:MAG TPA: glutamine-hydrolyzing GMP synthase, partial [Chryseosolibacter sp.]|nr:glutamine-hydrolyzing GMP synthase [Chryseosolibacter sp.]